MQEMPAFGYVLSPRWRALLQACNLYLTRNLSVPGAP
jgi:hypothetical protein